MDKKEYTLIDPKDIFSNRGILDTTPGETRYFLFEKYIPIKATAPKEGGLEIEKFVDGDFIPATSILSYIADGADLKEIDQAKFESLTS